MKIELFSCVFFLLIYFQHLKQCLTHSKCFNISGINWMIILMMLITLNFFLIHSAQFHPVSHSRKRLEVFSSPGRTQGPGAILTTVNVVLWMLRHFQPSHCLLPDYCTQRLGDRALGNWTSQDGRSRCQHQEKPTRWSSQNHSIMKPTHGKSQPFTHVFHQLFRPHS